MPADKGAAATFGASRPHAPASTAAKAASVHAPASDATATATSDDQTSEDDAADATPSTSSAPASSVPLSPTATVLAAGSPPAPVAPRPGTPSPAGSASSPSSTVAPAAGGALAAAAQAAAQSTGASALLTPGAAVPAHASLVPGAHAAHGAPSKGNDNHSGASHNKGDHRGASSHPPGSQADKAPASSAAAPPSFLDLSPAVPAPAAPAEPPLPTFPAHLLAPAQGLSADALPMLFAPPAMPPAASLLFAQAADDPSLRANIQADGASVSLDAGAAGELRLHLRVKDGVADVRVDGAAAATLDVRQQDLRAALASEGLTLGGFESGSQTRDQSAAQDHFGDQPASDGWRDSGRPSPADTAPAAATLGVRPNPNTTTAALLGGRLHVTA